MSKHTPGYEISRDGKIFSVAHNWRGYGRRQLVSSLNYHGYPSVRLTVNGKRTRYAVHVLVAKEYLPIKPSEEHEIRHLDGNKLNSAAENLAWGTKKDNANDRACHGRTSCGKLHSEAIRKSRHKECVKRGAEHYQAKRRVSNA